MVLELVVRWFPTTSVPRCLCALYYESWRRLRNEALAVIVPISQRMEVGVI